MSRVSKHSFPSDGAYAPRSVPEVPQRFASPADRHAAVVGPAWCFAPHGATLLSSDDGSLTYAIRAAGARLFIQRSQRWPTGTMAVQCLLIGGREEFRRWCAAEPTRFEHPILFERLRRCGDDAFDHAG